jgi:tetratricopeptide (TPR) repeat protein
MLAPIPRSAARRHDHRLIVAASVTAAVVLGGALIAALPGRGVPAEVSEPFVALTAAPSRPPPGVPEAAAPVRDPLAQRALDRAAELIERQRYAQAIDVLNHAQPLLKDKPQAYLLIGRALEGQGDAATARDFYLAAVDRDPYLYEGYWGVATTSESLGELDAALGAMRSYLHTEPDKHPDRLRVAQARSAIWEWEAKLGRGPWGPTQGIPPGYTADEIRRDGRGVGIKMPIPGTEGPDGNPLAEMKHADKQVIFPRP